MAVVITGDNTPTAGGVVYGDGTTYATTTAGTSGRPIVSGGSGAPTFRPYTLPASDGSASQFLQTDGAGALSFATVSAGYTLGTPIATTSGATAEFTGIPSTIRQIILSFNQITFATGTGNYAAIQVSTSSAYLTSGYVGRMGTLRSASVSPDALSTRISICNGTYVQNGDTLTGSLTMTLLDSSTNTWTGSSMLAVNGSNNAIFLTPFTFALASPLNKLKLFDAAGSNFSNGSFNIAYI
jgi:hypothetical protein